MTFLSVDVTRKMRLLERDIITMGTTELMVLMS
jgi:hypothetical protein